MARRANSTSKAVARKAVSRVAGAVKKTAKKLTARLRKPKPAATAAPAPRKAGARTPKKAARSASEPRRKPRTDIPLETLDNMYTPTQTSLKGPFRTNGADRQRDQEMARGTGVERWNDEDRLTNKSGDPRIGTHGRTYEPGEKRRLAKGRK